MNRTRNFATLLTSTAAQRPGALAFLVSLLYCATALILASKKVFWNDELFTYYISRRPNFNDVWSALLTGAEQIPPLFYLITRASARAFGSGYIAFRLPEIVGYWVMAICLYYFVSQRTKGIYGLIAMIFPLATESLSYSVEARPYGLILALSGVALVTWQAASEGRYRLASLAGFALSLAGAISCHYYGILVFFPFAVGETVRSAIRRKLDLPMYAALAVGFTPLVIYAPLIRAARGFSSAFWAKPQWSNIIGFYQYLLYPTVLLLLSTTVVLAGGEWLRARKDEAADARRPLFLPWEVAVAAGFALIPVLAVFLAKTITGAFTNRYALPAVLGIAILFAWSAAILGRKQVEIGLLICGIAVFAFALNAARVYRSNARFAADARSELSALKKITRNRTGQVVVANPQRFLEFSHLAGEQGLASLVYLADRDLAVMYTGTDDVDLGLIYLKAWAPLHVEPFREYIKHCNDLTVIDDGQPFSWVVSELTGRGWKVVLAGNIGSAKLLTSSSPDLQKTRNSDATKLSLPADSGRE